jgi:SAM-dependent methyltransferase
MEIVLPDTVFYNNMPLPAKHLRFCGSKFTSDKYFLSSAQMEADRLVEFFDLSEKSRVLDVGCGVGRLPIGILSRIGEIQYYCGVDVSEKSIQWCQRNIKSKHPNYDFIYLDVKNPRYNPQGKNLDKDFQLQFEDKEFDIIYLYSVFSHMTTDDVIVYLKEFHRLLSPTGKIFLTAFIEDDVPDMVINPDNYKKQWKGLLHCVRYNKLFFQSLLIDNGFKIDRFDFEKEEDEQSGFYLFKST